MKIRPLKIVTTFLGMGLFFSTILFLFVLIAQPATAAKAATPARKILGNRIVAQIETAYFSLEDAVKGQAHRLGFAEAEAPWIVEGSGEKDIDPVDSLPLPTASYAPTPVIEGQKQGQPLAAAIEPSSDEPNPTATPSPVSSAWQLPSLKPYGTLPGEGQWQAYMTNRDGDIVALRTFLQPDPERPHTIVALVAFDLRQTSLGYVLGSEEPSLPGGPQGNGLIPADDREDGHIIATFNGGFLATHGAYGAMSGGIMPIPAKKDAGTVTIDKRGQVQIGIWGEDLGLQDNYIAWRQNASIVIHQGEINEKVYNGSVISWGGNLDGFIITWRSGLGISADNQTLFYFAGPSMSMPTLATTMQDAGVHNGILLDINAYWVHFAAIKSGLESLTADPLFREEMAVDSDRYLRTSPRDFFYLTVQP
jgi:hypothetical protein